MTDEKWISLPGFDSPKYEISDRGRVRNVETQRLMDIEHQEYNSQRVALSRNKKQRRYYIHRLVYQAFVGDIPDGMAVSHKHGTENTPENLTLVHGNEATWYNRKAQGFRWEDTHPGEEWRPIPEYPEHRVSNMGRVINTSTMSLLSITEKGTGGHGRVGLIKKGVQKKFFVHRLVYAAFNGHPDGVVCHENGRGADNRLMNLRTDTQQGNLEDRLQHGSLQHAESHYKSFLSADQVHEIRLAQGSIADISRRFDLNYFTVRDIRSGKTWKHLKTPGWEPRRKS